METYLNVIKTLDECVESKYLKSLSLDEAVDGEKKESIAKFIYAGIKKLWQLLLATFRKFSEYLKQLLTNKNQDIVLANDVTIMKCVYKFSPMVVANMKLLDKGNINPSTVDNIKSFMDKEKSNTITLKKDSKIDIKSLYSTCQSYINALSSSDKTNANSSDTYAKQAYTEYSAFVKDIISGCNDLQKGAQHNDNNLIDKYTNDNGEINSSRIAIDVGRGKLTHDNIEWLVSQPLVQEEFIGKTYTDKKPQKEWNKNYLGRLKLVVVAESFNKDYLLYLEQVADYVSKRKVNNRVI